MTFASFETSVDSGRPVELLKVSYLTNHWCYTTADASIVFDGNTYIPMPIKHDEVNPTGDVAKSTITILVPKDCPVGELFRVQPPSGVITVTMYSKHLDDAEGKTFWKGRIVNSEWEEPWLKLTSENVFSSLQRIGLRRKYSAQCPHALYGQGSGLCNVDKAAFQNDYLITVLSGVTITCPGATLKPDGFFAGGYLTWTHATGGYLEQRMIVESYATGELIITSPPQGLVVGQVVSVYPGCDHSLATCHSKFNNALNYGGTPFIPQKNPFGGTTLY